MDLTNAQVLITGGSEGIGKGLAERLLKAGSTVLVTGRSEEKLAKAKSELPGLLTYRNDIGIAAEREQLAIKVGELLPGLNIVINNAGIQRRTGLAEDNAPWHERQAEMDILLAAPIHLNHLLIPQLLAGKSGSLIVNVTSGGAYIPQAFAPVYSACKAALHSYTLNLRYALSQSSCRVAELIPPAVQTSLAKTDVQHGAPLDEFCDTVFRGLFESGLDEVGFGPTADIQMQINGQPQSTLFNNSTTRFPVPLYQP